MILCICHLILIYMTYDKEITMDNNIVMYKGRIINVELLGKKRMPSDVYDVFLSLEGQKKDLIIRFIENTLQVNKGYATVDAFIQIPILIKSQELIHWQRLYLEEVA